MGPASQYAVHALRAPTAGDQSLSVARPHGSARHHSHDGGSWTFLLWRGNSRRAGHRRLVFLSDCDRLHGPHPALTGAAVRAQQIERYFGTFFLSVADQDCSFVYHSVRAAPFSARCAPNHAHVSAMTPSVCQGGLTISRPDPVRRRALVGGCSSISLTSILSTSALVSFCRRRSASG